MNASTFASLGPSTFNRLVSARQAVVAAGGAYDAAERGCVCPGESRKCTCAAAPISEAAWRRYQDALAVRDDLERSWADYCAIRYGR